METKKPDPPVEAPKMGQYAGNVKSSGKYRLRTQHVLGGDRLLEAGTEVGNDTPIPWPGPPTPQMEGLDGPGKEAVAKLHKENYNSLPPWDFENNPEYEIHEKRRQEQEKETDSHPVSHAQAIDRGKEKEWKGPVPAPAPVLTKGGDTSGGITMPKINPEKPNEELYPKG